MQGERNGERDTERGREAKWKRGRGIGMKGVKEEGRMGEGKKRKEVRRQGTREEGQEGRRERE